MAEEKKAIGPVLLGKMPGGEKSTFLRYTVVESEKDPVFVTKGHHDAEQGAMRQEVASMMEQMARNATEGSQQAAASAGSEAGKSAGGAAGAEAGKEAGSAAGAESGKVAAEKVVKDAPAKTRAAMGYAPVDNLDFATKAYVDAQIKKMNDSLISLGIKLPKLFG